MRCMFLSQEEVEALAAFRMQQEAERISRVLAYFKRYPLRGHND